MLLDEPLSSLDTAVRVNLQEAIRRIQQELGITSILVTHDLSEAMGMSDRMALLLNGKVGAIDIPMRLFQKPPTIEAARFVGIHTFLKGLLEKSIFKTNDGEFKVNSNGHSVQSTAFAIRPEHIQIQAEPTGNSLQGIVTDCMYRGEYIEYQVMTAGSNYIRARVPMPAKVIPQGKQIYVVFPREHLFEIHN